jgi:mono/diheme cytochrome c family protein
VLFAIGPGPAMASPQDAVLDALKAQAVTADSGFSGFSAANGKALFLATHSGGKPDTPSCSTCHTKDPHAAGQTRAGKAIEPMAVSANGKRFTDMDKVEKWFRRNCNSVLGRDCTAQEKGDFATWLIGQ